MPYMHLAIINDRRHLVLDMTTEFGHFGHFRYHLVSYDTRRAVKVG